MESRRDRRTPAPDARRLILARRAAFMSAALSAIGCAASAGSNATAPPAASSTPPPRAPPSASAAHAASADAGTTPAESALPSSSVLPRPAIVKVCLSIVILTRPEFAPGALDPLPDAALILDEAAAILRERPQIRLEIAGHQDTLEPDRSGTVSLTRAERVRFLLVRRGIDAGRLCARGYGASRPLAPNDSAADRAKNRRVEFRILEPNETCEP